jgi:hypothetical protein
MIGRGAALIAFHIGDDVVHIDDLFGAKVSLDFRFHQPETVVEALRTAGVAVLEPSEREAYEGVEYPNDSTQLTYLRTRSYQLHARRLRVTTTSLGR